MQKLKLFFLVLSLAFAGQACEGPEGPAGPPGPTGAAGPQGPAGPAGPAGASVTAEVYEFPADFEPDENNNYSILVNFEAEEIEVGEGDVILLYLLMGAGGTEQEPIYFWSPLPQTFTLGQDSTVTYNYASSNVAMVVFLQSSFTLSTLPAAELEGLTKGNGFRLVIVPGSLMGGKTAKPPVDFKNYDEVIKYFNLSEKKVKKISLK